MDGGVVMVGKEKRRKMEFPDELWNLVKDYQIDHKKHHKINIEPCLEYIDGLYSEVYLYSSVFPTLGYGPQVEGYND